MSYGIYSVSVSQRPRDLAEEERLLRDAVRTAGGPCQQQSAAALLERLEITQPEEPRWPHQRGDALRKLGAFEEMTEAYMKAAHLYDRLGFRSRANAVRALAREAL